MANVNYSSIFPTSSGTTVTNTLLLLRPVDGKIIDLVSGYEPTKMFYYNSSSSSNGKITIDSLTKKFNTSIKIQSALLNTLSNHFYNSNFTIELWYKPLSGLPSTFNPLIARGDITGSSVKSTLYLGFSSSNFGMGIGDGTNLYDAFIGTAPNFINTSSFTHYAIVRNSNIIKTYVNGTLKLTSTAINQPLYDIRNQVADKISDGLSFGGDRKSTRLNSSHRT